MACIEDYGDCLSSDAVRGLQNGDVGTSSVCGRPEHCQRVYTIVTVVEIEGTYAIYRRIVVSPERKPNAHLRTALPRSTCNPIGSDRSIKLASIITMSASSVLFAEMNTVEWL